MPSLLLLSFVVWVCQFSGRWFSIPRLCSISNLGMFGIREFTAIISEPQVAILAVGSGLPKASTATDTGVTFRTDLTFTLSIDSRAVTELMAARFLQHVTSVLTLHPEVLLSDDPVVGKGADVDDFDTIMLSYSAGGAAASTAPELAPL